MSSNFIKKASSLTKIKLLAQNELNAMDLIIKERLSSKAKLVQDITSHIISSGGKRLRPTLLILIAKLFNYNGNRHINLAAAVEFIHTATLLHDDVVDHSDLRRVVPTANQSWDNKSSILVGDFLFSQSFILMSEDSDIKALQILSKAASIIAEGEVKQLTSIANLDLNLEGYLQIISAKTAELFAASCKVGALIAGVDDNIQFAMYQFGLNLGIAFQIMDDVLDYMASKMAIGKNIGDDFKESKVTLPIILAYQMSGEEERIFWNRVIKQKNQEDRDFEIALKIFEKYKIIDKCLLIAEEFIQLAQNNINIAPDSEIKTALIEVLNFSVSRAF
jgi:octaprenyl-diphosphate synthase